MTLLLLISLLFPLVLITGLRIFTAFVLFALILLFLGLCQSLVRIYALSCLFFLLIGTLLLFGGGLLLFGGGLIITRFFIYFIFRFLLNGRFLLNSRLRLLVLFILFVFVLCFGSIIYVFLYFFNSLNYIIGCNWSLLLLFLLVGACQECCHHIVALGGH